MNTKLVDFLIQVILSLSKEERHLLEENLFFESSSPSTGDLMQMAQKGGSFNFLYDEPDLYTQGRWGSNLMSVKKGDIVLVPFPFTELISIGRISQIIL